MKTLIHVLSVAMLMIGTGFTSTVSASHITIAITEIEGAGPSVSASQIAGGLTDFNTVLSVEKSTITGHVNKGGMATPSLQQTAFILNKGGIIRDEVLLTVIDPGNSFGYVLFNIDFFSYPYTPQAIPSDFSQININESTTDPRFITQSDAGSCAGFAGYFDLSTARCTDNFHIMVSSDIPEPPTLALMVLGLVGMRLGKRRNQPTSLAGLRKATYGAHRAP